VAPQQRRDSSDLIQQPFILLLKPLILSPEPCNFTLKAFDLFQMADLGRQKRDLSADCFETAVHLLIEVLFADPRPPVARGVEHSRQTAMSKITTATRSVIAGSNSICGPSAAASSSPAAPARYHGERM
jgi:hypothetical protein